MPHAEIHAEELDLVRVDTQWNEKDLITQIPGSNWDAKGRYWTVPRTWTAYVQLAAIFKTTITFGQNYVNWLNYEYEARIKIAMELRTKTTCDTVFDPRLRSFQNADVMWGLYAREGVLGSEMGVGKTPPLCVLLAFLPDSLPALAVVPNSTKIHWEHHLADWIPSVNAYIVDGNATQRRKIIDASRDDPRAVVVINIEAARQFSRLAPYGSVKLKRCRECDPKYGDNIKPTQCHVHPKELNGYGFKTILVDEIHRTRDTKSQQTRAIWALAHDPSVRWRFGATGTLIEHDPLESWSPMHIVAPLDWPTKGKVVDRYALVSWNAYGGTNVVGLRPDTRDEFHAIFDPHYRRMIKAIVLPELPPKVYPTPRYVDMTAHQARMYRELDEEMVTTDEADELIITPALFAKRVRMAQLACASLEVIEKPDEDDPTTWKMALKEPSPVLDELEAVLDELGDQQALIAADYKQLIMLAAKRLDKKGIPYALITGDVSNFERDRALQALRDKRIRALLFTVKTGGAGLDMSAAPNLIFIQRPWSMIDYKQAEDRPHRIGAEVHESIQIIHIVTRGTVEEDKIISINDKLTMLEELNRDREQLRSAGLLTDAAEIAFMNREAEIMHSQLTSWGIGGDPS